MLASLLLAAATLALTIDIVIEQFPRDQTERDYAVVSPRSSQGG